MRPSEREAVADLAVDLKWIVAASEGTRSRTIVMYALCPLRQGPDASAQLIEGNSTRNRRPGKNGNKVVGTGSVRERGDRAETRCHEGGPKRVVNLAA